MVLASGQVKILVLGCVLVELIGPRCLEINGVGENQAGERRDGAGAEQVLDLVVGLLFDPLVDGGAYAVGSRLEIDCVKSCAVIAFDQIQIGRQELLVLLSPKRVGHAQRVSLVRGIHAGQQRAHGRVQALLRQRVVEDAGHLGGCLAVGTGIGHGEVRGDAFRREEEISRRCAEPAVKIDGERRCCLGRPRPDRRKGLRAARRRRQPG